jgi:hypothetical protein
MKKNKTLLDLFSFPGFKAKSILIGKFGDHKARIVMLRRQKKLPHAPNAERNTKYFTIEKNANLEILMQPTIEFICAMKKDVSIVQGAIKCA